MGLDEQAVEELLQFLGPGSRTMGPEELLNDPFRPKPHLNQRPTRYSDGSWRVFYSALERETSEQEAGHHYVTKIPCYSRIRDHFASLIAAGTLTSGMKLPAERTLSGEFRVTRVTVRQALMQLEAEGLIFRENRRGWFVSPPRIRCDPTANASFTEIVTEQGRVAGTTVLSTEQIAASTWESKNLSCAVGDPIFLIRRLRSVDGRAVLVEHLHVKAERCPDLLEYPLDRSLTELMSEKYGIIERRARINRINGM